MSIELSSVSHEFIPSYYIKFLLNKIEIKNPFEYIRPSKFIFPKKLPSSIILKATVAKEICQHCQHRTAAAVI